MSPSINFRSTAAIAAGMAMLMMASGCMTMPASPRKPAPHAPAGGVENVPIPPALAQPEGYEYTPTMEELAAAKAELDGVMRGDQLAAAPAVRITDDLEADLKNAFDYVCTQHGNPTIIRIFTNDPQKGEDLRKRLELLARVEQLRADIRRLEAELARLEQAKGERKATIDELEARIIERRKAVAAFVRLAAQAERTFTATGAPGPGPQDAKKTPASPAPITTKE